MKVKVLKTDTRLGVKENEVYEAVKYPLDSSKVILESRVPDGYDPMCTHYWYEVEVIEQ